jgi:hypothetical protein
MAMVTSTSPHATEMRNWTRYWGDMRLSAQHLGPGFRKPCRRVSQRCRPASATRLLDHAAVQLALTGGCPVTSVTHS